MADITCLPALCNETDLAILKMKTWSATAQSLGRYVQFSIKAQ